MVHEIRNREEGGGERESGEEREAGGKEGGLSSSSFFFYLPSVGVSLSSSLEGRLEGGTHVAKLPFFPVE